MVDSKGLHDMWIPRRGAGRPCHSLLLSPPLRLTRRPEISTNIPAARETPLRKKEPNHESLVVIERLCWAERWCLGRL